MEPNPALPQWEVSPISLSSPLPNPLYSPLSHVQHKAFEAEASVSQSYPRTSTDESEGRNRGSREVGGRREGESREEGREPISHPVSPKFPSTPASQLPNRLFSSSLSFTSSRDSSRPEAAHLDSSAALDSMLRTNSSSEPEREEKAKATVLKRKRLEIEPNRPILPDKRTWTDIKNAQGDEQNSYKPVRCSEPGIFFEPRRGLYQVSTFIPKTSFLDTDLVGLANLTQKLVIDLPSVKMIELTLKPHENFADFTIYDGYGTGCILRSQRNKVLLRIHTHEYYISQGDSFFLPTGNSLSMANTAERLSVLLQLVLIKCP